MKAWQSVLVGFLGGLLLGGVILLFFLPQRGEPIRLITASPNLTFQATSTPAFIQVHVTGAVQSPGVYTLPEGARNLDGINAAGGATSAADLESLNLSEYLKDGQRLYIPSKGEIVPTTETTATSAPAPEANGLININTADATELMNLPGIGEVKAAAIIAYRQTYGPFTSIEQLLNVKGIGNATLNTIRNLITLGP